MVWSFVAAELIRRDREKKKERANAPKTGSVPKAIPDGLPSYYDDSWGPMLEYLQGIQGNSAPAGMYRNILENFRGDEKHLENFLDRSGPFVAAALQGTPAFQAATDLSYDDPMQSFGGGASQIRQSAQVGQQNAQRVLSQSGLGRSAARASLASSTAANVGAQTGDLYTNLMANRNRIRRAAATSAFDQHRLVTAMALGHNPSPRVDMPNNSGNSQALAAGGALLGTLVAPGLGTAIGGGLGAAAG